LISRRRLASVHLPNCWGAFWLVMAGPFAPVSGGIRRVGNHSAFACYFNQASLGRRHVKLAALIVEAAAHVTASARK
jgi:hypothetical protein